MPRRILVAEDSLTQAEALRALLEGERYQVTVVRSGEQALERLEAADFDLVLSDIVMPGMNGYELCRRIKSGAQGHHLPVLLLTSLNDPMDIVRGLECGADNYITKPYDPQQLLARVRRVLEGRPLRRSHTSDSGVHLEFRGRTFTLTSDKEQVLDLLLSSIEDVVHTNRALQESQRELAEVHIQLEDYARRKALEAQVSTERYQALMQRAGDAILVLDAEGRILETNARATELLGRSSEELLQRPLASFMSAGDAEAFRAHFARLQSKQQIEVGERQLVRADGHTVFAEISASLTTLDSEELVLVIVHDITKRKRAEQALYETNRTLQALIQASPLAILTLDTQGRVMLWNPAAERIFGWSEREVLYGSSPLVPEDMQERFGELRQQILRGRSLTGIELQARKKDGSSLEVSLSAAPLWDQDGRISGIVSLIADISARKAAEQALQQSEEQLRQAKKMEAIGRLAGGIAHDFNNILTAIKGTSQLLLQELERSEPLRSDLETIDRMADRAAALTRQLLAFSRKQVLQARVLDLNTTVLETYELLQRVIGEDIELVTVLNPALARVKADPGQIQQVLLNLAVNARDAMPQGGKLIIETRNVELEEPHIDGHAPLPPGRYIMLAVSDTGVGMDRETRTRIFEPFFTTKEVGKGTGMGLSTVYGIVQQSGGQIAVYSEPGIGSTFKIYLPTTQETQDEVKPRAAPAARARGSETVLLVEDEDPVRRLARKILEHHGYTVLEAGEGEEALRVAERHRGPIHALVTDVVMPRMGGREVAERLLRSRPEIRVLYLSGYPNEALARHGSLERGSVLLDKPFSPDTLARTLRELLDQPARR